MIQLYKRDNKNYEFNGDVVLQPYSCVLKQELQTGLNELELEHFYDDDSRWKEIEIEDVVSVPTPYKNIPNQLYRIYDISKSMSSITVKARHIFYDLIDKIIIDKRATNKNGEEALKIILQDTPFTASSNILSSKTAYFVRKNIIEAIAGDCENSFVNRWGGELFVDNFKVYMNDRIGTNNNVTIEYGKNLVGLEEEINLESVVTRIIPVGYDGIMLEGENCYVDSKLINNYAHIKMQEIKYDDVKLKDKSIEDDDGFNTIEEARAELIRRCKLEYSENNIDKPLVAYKVEFLDLSKLEEYKDYKILETVCLGDTVKIKHHKLNINIEARVSSFEYDCISEKYINVELGNYLNNYAREKAKTNIDLEKICKSFNGEGKLNGGDIQGYINAMKSPVLAQRTVAQKQDVVAMLCEDLDPSSEYFGAMCFGSKGFMIADKRTYDNRDWDWKTFGTGKGFVADLIVTGTILGDRIKGGTLSSLDDSFKMDLNNGRMITYTDEGGKALELKNNNINFYNIENNGEEIGSISSLQYSNDVNKAGIGIIAEKDKFVQIGQARDEFNTHAFMQFDYKQRQPISVFNNIAYENGAIGTYYKNNKLQNVVFQDLGGAYRIASKNKISFGAFTSDGVSNLDCDNMFEIGVGVGNYYSAYCRGKFGVEKDFVGFQDGIFTGSIRASNISTRGEKNRIVRTDNYGDLKLNAYETAECYFGDIGRSRLKNKKCVIKIDNKFKATVNTNIQYEVKTWAYGNANVWVDIKKMYAGYFVVEGTDDVEFGYEIIAKQKDYENNRLEEYVRKEDENGN